MEVKSDAFKESTRSLLGQLSSKMLSEAASRSPAWSIEIVVEVVVAMTFKYQRLQKKPSSYQQTRGQH